MSWFWIDLDTHSNTNYNSKILKFDSNWWNNPTNSPSQNIPSFQNSMSHMNQNRKSPAFKNNMYSIYQDNMRIPDQRSVFTLFSPTHQAGSSFLILWILQENGLLGIGGGYCGHTMLQPWLRDIKILHILGQQF